MTQRILLIFLFLNLSFCAFAQMKTWWFFGYERTGKEGIVADITALKDAGFSGVVYYDQNHAADARANGAEDGFSSQWWENLRFAATQARRAGMSFEVNISNGYVAGGSWIDPAHAMQRLESADTLICGGGKVRFRVPAILGREGYVKDVALLAIPYRADSSMRHITARYPAKGKGRNGAMQIPGKSDSFMGAGFKAMPDIGVLQVSDDSLTWRDVVSLEHMYSSQGGYYVRTTAFPATKGRYWRVKYNSDLRLKEWTVGPEALMDRWEEKAALQSDFTGRGPFQGYGTGEAIDLGSILDLSALVQPDGSIEWEVPAGNWKVVRLASVLTGAKSKHGRQNLLGYECDKLSREAAELQWDSYVRVILDSLNTGSEKLIDGVTMDSHEGGSQNWTPLMLEEFRERRGYDLRPYLLALAGYVLGSEEQTEQVLWDLRRTINECMRDNYYATFQRKCSENGLSFTAQAIGNALCITGDAISVKSAVEKPQGEFWTYQQTGAYDVKDCSSAAHLYGKKIASAEAMTDAEYKDSPLDLKRVADIAFSMGAQEFVVCATPHIPIPQARNYVAGREYAINRSNPKWESFKPVWREINKSMKVLRKGKAAPDVLIFLGDGLPVKTLTHKLPEGLDGLDWDVCTGDALLNRISATEDGLLTTPDSIVYKALIIEDEIWISPQSASKIEALKSRGVKVLRDGYSIERPLQITSGAECVVHTHRIIDGRDVFFIANISGQTVTIEYNFEGGDRPRHLKLRPGESRFIRKQLD